MIKLHEDLEYLSSAFAGILVRHRENDYHFSGLRLWAEREPPVAEGYVLHIRLMIDAWQWGETTRLDGQTIKVKKKFTFRPEEVTFVTTSIEDGEPR